MRITLVILSLVCAVVLFGCAKTENTNNSNTATSHTAKPATNPASETPAMAGEKIGIPECDEYIAKYEACAGKVPEAGRAAYNSALEQTRATWKKLADNPTTKPSLVAACKQAAEQQAAAWKMYGCN